ncbi:hypothetical protein THAOC_32893, partial [Thalassiosira oceanica]
VEAPGVRRGAAQGTPTPASSPSILPARTPENSKGTRPRSDSTASSSAGASRPARGPRRSQTRCAAQPGRVSANDVPNAAHQDPISYRGPSSLTVRPRSELTAKWALPLPYLRGRMMGKLGGDVPAEEARGLTIRDALRGLTVGLFRRGCADNGPAASIVSKEILAEPGDDRGGRRGRRRGRGRRPPPQGLLLRRRRQDRRGTRYRALLLPPHAGQRRLPPLLRGRPVRDARHGTGRELRPGEPVRGSRTGGLGVPLRGEEGDGDGGAELRQEEGGDQGEGRGGEAQGGASRPGLADGGRRRRPGAGGEGTAAGDERKEGGGGDGPDAPGGILPALPPPPLPAAKFASEEYGNERRWREAQCMYAGVLRAALTNDACSNLFRRDMAARMRLEYHLWCPIVEAFAPNPFAFGGKGNGKGDVDPARLLPGDVSRYPQQTTKEHVKMCRASRAAMQREVLGFVPTPDEVTSLVPAGARRKGGGASRRGGGGGGGGTNLFDDLTSSMRRLHEEEYAVSDAVVRRREEVRRAIEGVVTASGDFPGGTKVAVFGSLANGFG